MDVDESNSTDWETGRLGDRRYESEQGPFAEVLGCMLGPFLSLLTPRHFSIKLNDTTT